MGNEEEEGSGSLSETEYTLGTQCGITFAGLKPASLFWMKNRCVESLGTYAEAFAKRDFAFKVLRENDGKSLLFVYHRVRLKNVLFRECNREFLESRGYRYGTTEEAVELLKERISGDGEFPHEVGIYLGYPLDDVLGFMNSSSEGVCFAGYWKVYAEPEKKAKLFAQYRRCSDRICCKLSEGDSLTAIFKV